MYDNDPRTGLLPVNEETIRTAAQTLRDYKAAKAPLEQRILEEERWYRLRHWEVAGDFELEQGVHTIALHDLTGYFGRCASILLTLISVLC